MKDSVTLKSGIQVPHDGWLKTFTDNSFEEGWDFLIDSRRASWSRGKLTNLRAVSLCNNNTVCSIWAGQFENNFWQSDDWEVALFTSAGYRTTRRIQKQIGKLDNYLLLEQSESSITLRFAETIFPVDEKLCVLEIRSEHEKQWLVMEVDIKTNTVVWYINKDKI